jgi:hypothetical protein
MATAKLPRLLLVMSTFTLAILFVTPALAQSASWELVRSVENPYTGTIDLVLIPAQKQRDREYLAQAGNAVCGDRSKCLVNFWTDRDHIPTTAQMPVSDLAVMTGTYERNPSHKEPVVRLACWLYPNREAGELMSCGYFPGAKVPWEMQQTPSWAK